jgi:hypothetical protein
MMQLEKNNKFKMSFEQVRSYSTVPGPPVTVSSGPKIRLIHSFIPMEEVVGDSSRLSLHHFCQSRPLSSVHYKYYFGLG